MTDKLEILLVEDDPLACSEIVSIIEESEDMILVDVTNNVKKALERVLNALPDAIILDLELHQGYGSGLNLLSEMQNSSLTKTPYILVTTNNVSPVTYEAARNLGADYIFTKHQPNYSAQTVIEFLRILSPTLLARRKDSNAEQAAETPTHNAKRTYRRIVAELNKVCINPKDIGYRYLADAIEIMMTERQKNVAKIISKKYEKSEGSVTRAMQNAINRAWNTACTDDLLCHYTAAINSEKGMPTVTEFICYYAHKLNNQY